MQGMDSEALPEAHAQFLAALETGFPGLARGKVEEGFLNIRFEDDYLRRYVEHAEDAQLWDWEIPASSAGARKSLLQESGPLIEKIHLLAGQMPDGAEGAWPVDAALRALIVGHMDLLRVIRIQGGFPLDLLRAQLKAVKTYWNANRIIVAGEPLPSAGRMQVLLQQAALLGMATGVHKPVD